MLPKQPFILIHTLHYISMISYEFVYWTIFAIESPPASNNPISAVLCSLLPHGMAWHFKMVWYEMVWNGI